MTVKIVLWVRVLIAMATLIALSETLISFFKNWFPGPIYTFLLILSFITLANGVSYLSEAFRLNIKYLKLLTGILSLIILVFTLFPQDHDTSPIIGWASFIVLSSSSILISVFSSLEWAKLNIKFRWFFPFLFALISGIYSFFIASMILRNFNSFEGGVIVISYSTVLSLISIMVNSIAVSFLKNKIGG
jgi:hypothetical protein